MVYLWLKLKAKQLEESIKANEAKKIEHELNITKLMEQLK